MEIMKIHRGFVEASLWWHYHLKFNILKILQGILIIVSNNGMADKGSEYLYK
jgi:hypothetical protein